MENKSVIEHEQDQKIYLRVKKRWLFFENSWFASNNVIANPCLVAPKVFD